MEHQTSVLNETAFSHFNLRDAYITDFAEYAATLRDEIIFSNNGVKAMVKIPKHENDVDEYSNFVDDDFTTSVEVVVPLFKQYRENVSIEGMSADGTLGVYPLEVVIPSKLHLPRNSRIVLIEYNNRNEKVAREWTVLSTIQKQLSGSKTYSRIANCVSSRATIYHTGEVDNNFAIGYWKIYPVEAGTHKVTDEIHANWNAWWVRFGIDRSQVLKVHREEYNEVVDDEITYREQLNDEDMISPFLDDMPEGIMTGKDLVTGETAILPNPKVIQLKEMVARFVMRGVSASVLY